MNSSDGTGLSNDASEHWESFDMEDRHLFFCLYSRAYYDPIKHSRFSKLPASVKKAIYEKMKIAK